jgi:hypothetical protein
VLEAREDALDGGGLRSEHVEAVISKILDGNFQGVYIGAIDIVWLSASVRVTIKA